MHLGLTQLISDFSNFSINICSRLEYNENVNLQINLIFVGAFHQAKSWYSQLLCLTFSIKRDSVKIGSKFA